MRLRLALSLVLSLSLGSAPAIAAEPAPAVQSPAGGLIMKKHFGTREVTPRHFVVECQLDGIVDGNHKKPISSPRVVVPDGERATMQVVTQTPFVTGVRNGSAEGKEPVVTVLNSGVEAEVLVKALDEQSAQVDVTIKRTKISDVQAIESPTDPEATLQAPVTSACEIRTVRAVSLGETVQVACGCSCCKTAKKMTLELKVDEVDPEEPAITPLSTAEPADETVDDPTVFAVAYIVDSLLEPYAIKKRDEELEDSDFVPIIDTVLREALVTWPEDAEIRPIPEKRALVIIQTRQGHREIADLLRDKRDHMADVQKLLRR